MQTFVLLAYAGIVMLGFVRAPVLRTIGRLLTIGAAAGFTALAVSLFRLGSDRGWSGDGPAMLVVMLLIPAAGVIALATWGAVAEQWRLRRSEGVSPGLALAVLAVGLAGSALSARDQVRAGMPSHDATIVAVALAAERGAVVSLDEAGTLKTWDVASRRFTAERREPALAGARALLVTPSAEVAVALAAERAVVLPLGEPGAPVVILDGVDHAALLPGPRLAWSHGDTLHVGERLPPLASAPPVAAFGVPVRALSADREGTLAVALGDGRLVVLGDGRRELAALAEPATRLAFSPGGAWLVAGADTGAAHVVDLRSGAVRPLPAWIGLHHPAFVADDRLVFTSEPGSPSAQVLSLAAPEPTVGPWMNHGQTVTAIGAAPGAADAAVALGAELFLARAPARPGDPADATRLVHRR